MSRESGREAIECDVAIVGAGPVGATLAALLGQAGSRVFIADSSRNVYPLPRAAHFDHEVMRIFQQLGIVEAIAESIISGDRYTFQNRAGDVLLDFDLSQPTETGWKGYMIHQPGIERAIRERVVADPRVDLRLGVAFSHLHSDPAGVTSWWDEDGQTIEVRSRFLVGCDGASSSVREAIGAGLDDLGFDEPWLVLDVVVDEHNGLPDRNIQYCDPERPTTYVVMGNRRRRFEFMLKAGETAEAMITDATVARLLEPWNTFGVREVERKAVYRFHALVADRWQAGRVFIAGDAAHQMPPFAGQGMCSGIRDVAGLAWRLPLAEVSHDPRMLFDSYQREREPHVRAITDAAIATGRVVCILDPVQAAARDTQMLAVKAAGEPMPDISSPPITVAFGLPSTPHAGRRFFQPVLTGDTGVSQRMDDVLGPGAWLIMRGDVGGTIGAAGLRVVTTADAGLRPFRTALEHWLESIGVPAVLVRADRYVFGTGTAHELLAAYRKLAGV